MAYLRKSGPLPPPPYPPKGPYDKRGDTADDINPGVPLIKGIYKGTFKGFR